MNFENNEERIANLEKSVAELVRGQKQLAHFILGQNVQDGNLLNLILLQKKDNISTLKCLVSIPLLIDENVRRIFFRMIEKMENELANALIQQSEVQKKALASWPILPPI